METIKKNSNINSTSFKGIIRYIGKQEDLPVTLNGFNIKPLKKPVTFYESPGFYDLNKLLQNLGDRQNGILQYLENKGINLNLPDCIIKNEYSLFVITGIDKIKLDIFFKNPITFFKANINSFKAETRALEINHPQAMDIFVAAERAAGYKKSFDKFLEGKEIKTIHLYR